LRLAARRGKAELATPSAASYLAQVFGSLSPRAGVAGLLHGFQRVSAPQMKQHDRSYLGGAL
jgi:hypothetical protein